MILLWIIAFALAGSAGAIVASSVILVLPKQAREILIPPLLSYATGTLLATALLGLLPEAIELAAVPPVMVTMLSGLIVFFTFERMVLWRHCHVEGCEAHGAAGVLILAGDALHHFADGVVIATAFHASIPLGMTTALAVIVHELPQEAGDFAILLDGGFPRRRAFIWNMISGLTTLPGSVLGHIAFEGSQAAVPYALALSAASFLYIALADLIPGLHRRIGVATGASQLLLIVLGIVTIVLIGLYLR